MIPKNYYAIVLSFSENSSGVLVRQPTNVHNRWGNLNERRGDANRFSTLTSRALMFCLGVAGIVHPAVK